MENQTTAPEVQSEQTETVVQNNTEATPQTVLTETEKPKKLKFKHLIPENFRDDEVIRIPFKLKRCQIAPMFFHFG